MEIYSGFNIKYYNYSILRTFFHGQAWIYLRWIVEKHAHKWWTHSTEWEFFFFQFRWFCTRIWNCIYTCYIIHPFIYWNDSVIRSVWIEAVKWTLSGKRKMNVHRHFDGRMLNYTYWLNVTNEHLHCIKKKLYVCTRSLNFTYIQLMGFGWAETANKCDNSIIIL